MAALIFKDFVFNTDNVRGTFTINLTIKSRIFSSVDDSHVSFSSLWRLNSNAGKALVSRTSYAFKPIIPIPPSPPPVPYTPTTSNTTIIIISVAIGVVALIIITIIMISHYKKHKMMLEDETVDQIDEKNSEKK
jgi:hypothetical protein